MSIEISNRYANIAAGILDKARRDLGTDEECVIRDLVTALMHYATTGPGTHRRDQHQSTSTAHFLALLNHGPPAANPDD